MDRLGVLNPNLVKSDVSIISNEAGVAVVSVNPNSTIYLPGTVTITYRVAIDIGTVITTTDLG